MNEDNTAQFWGRTLEWLGAMDRRVDLLEANLEAIARRLERLELSVNDYSEVVGARDLRELLEAC